jgi:hypothetical protein
MARQIQGSQRDFSSGEIDVALKRSDDHPARKTGLRQMSNARILNSGAVQNRSGRRALYPVIEGGKRTERFTISSGHVFDIQFAAFRVKIIDSIGGTVANFTARALGAGGLPWTEDRLGEIVYALFGMSIYITYGHDMIPQVLTWDGVSTWTISDFTELTSANQKRTPFYRISQQGITLLPGARSGVGVSLLASAPVFNNPGHVNTRMRFCNRQMLITAVADAYHATVTIMESLPGHQQLGTTSDPRPSFSIGDVVNGKTSGSKGLITAIGVGGIEVQLITTNATSISVNAPPPGGDQQEQTVSFVINETLIGPAGSIVISSAGAIDNPTIGVTLWDEEVMNGYRGYPASVFADQFRLGFCDFASVPGGIGWSAINSPTDLYVGPNPSDAIFEIVPDKVRVFHVVPGPESSEFVFCDHKLYYIRIDASNPLKPGSVGFQALSSDGCAQVQPRASQEAILYVNAGRNSVMAIIAAGNYNRPFNTRNLSEFHSHLFSNIVAIAVPTADGTFNERYAYVLNADGSMAVGKYTLGEGQIGAAGWGPWSGVGTVNWVSAWSADVLFTTTYFGVPVVEILDDTQFLDAAFRVNAVPSAFEAPPGKGPLWWIPLQTVSLRTDRTMGDYVIDADGFIIPQFTGGEDLTDVALAAGRPWTMTVEPFCPDAPSGADMGQRMTRRRVSRFAAYVINSTGFLMARLFSGRQTRTTHLGDIMNIHRVPMWAQDDDPAIAPHSRETVESWRPVGRTFDPRVAIIKDTPGTLLIAEIAIEVTL